MVISENAVEKWALNKIIKYDNEYSSINITKIKAYMYSFILGCLAVYPTIYFDHYLKEAYDDISNLNKFILIALLSVSLSIIEIYFLYIITFKVFVKIYKNYSFSEDEFKDDIVYSFYAIMARVAIESSEKPIDELKLDLFKKRSKYTYYTTQIFYKIKIILSNAIAKVLMRKILARSAFKGLADYIVVPITGIWDAIVMYLVIKKIENIFENTQKIENFFREIDFFNKNFSLKFKEIIFRILVNAIVYDAEYHPNYKQIIKIFKKHNFITISFDKINNIYNTNKIVSEYSKLPKTEKEILEKFYYLVLSISKKRKLDFKIKG